MNKVRYVVWSADMAHVALLGKHGESRMPFTGHSSEITTLSQEGGILEGGNLLLSGTVHECGYCLLAKMRK